MASSPFFTDEAQLNQASADHPFLPSKKKRNLPGNPNPDAEVIALSPRTLMATNRFVCEVCSKGFQREQNLQLHRRGHNLPWKLKQKSGGKETRRRVYLCPEPSCVHHDPSRALGDLTGIKKHFSRKHGEKKWKCEKCAKRYAVQSDWKAHSKTCGTREYRCDCGTLFSRRDSFITHRAFCDALAQESARQLPSHNPFYRNSINTNFASEHNFSYAPPLIMDHDSSLEAKQPPNSWHGLMHLPLEHNVFMNLSYAPPLISDHDQASAATMFCEGEACGLPQMSATALLQKAAQIGATTSSSPAFRTGSNLMDVMTSFAFGRGKEEAQGASYHTNASDDALTRDFLGMRGFSHLDTFPDELSKSVAMSNRFFHTNTQD